MQGSGAVLLRSMLHRHKVFTATKSAEARLPGNLPEYRSPGQGWLIVYESILLGMSFSIMHFTEGFQGDRALVSAPGSMQRAPLCTCASRPGCKQRWVENEPCCCGCSTYGGASEQARLVAYARQPCHNARNECLGVI